MARDQIHHDQTGTFTGRPASETNFESSTEMGGACAIAEPTAVRSEPQSSAPASEPERQARNVATQASDSAHKAVEHAREAARDTTRRIREQGTSLATAQKERAAEELSHFGRAIHRAAETLHDEGDHNIADYADMAAGQIDQATDYLRERDLGALVDDAEETTRRRPELVYGGLFVAGLALSRFLKASTRNRRRVSQSDNSELMARAY